MTTLKNTLSTTFIAITQDSQYSNNTYTISHWFEWKI
jgi:hypothetical protein